MIATQPAPLSLQEIKDSPSDLKPIFEMVDALTPQLYSIERQRVALQTEKQPDFFDQLRPMLTSSF